MLSPAFKTRAVLLVSYSPASSAKRKKKLAQLAHCPAQLLQIRATAAQLAHSSHWIRFAAMPPPNLAELVKQRTQSSSTPARKAFVDAAAATAAKEQGNKLLAQNDLLAAYAQYSAGLASADASDAAKLFGNRSAAALKLGWPAAAIEDACAAVSADVTYARGWFRLAAALVEAGDPLATEACGYAADLAPRDPGPARLYERARHEDAERYKPGKATMVAVAVAPAPEESEETDAADDSDASDGDDASERVVSLALATRTQTSGGTVWDASVLLASWLATDPTIVRGRNVLELGAGCGAVRA